MIACDNVDCSREWVSSLFYPLADYSSVEWSFVSSFTWDVWGLSLHQKAKSSGTVEIANNFLVVIEGEGSINWIHYCTKL